MGTPYFSIVIPTYNRSDLFPYAVKSILKQTYDNVEVILSDNFSTDDSPDVASQFSDPRFRYVRTPRHFHIADAWEFARSHATGKLIMMLSDDDTLAATALEHLYSEAEYHGGAGGRPADDDEEERERGRDEQLAGGRPRQAVLSYCTFFPFGYEGLPAVASLVKSQLARIGLSVSIVRTDSSSCAAISVLV